MPQSVSGVSVELGEVTGLSMSVDSLEKFTKQVTNFNTNMQAMITLDASERELFPGFRVMPEVVEERDEAIRQAKRGDFNSAFSLLDNAKKAFRGKWFKYVRNYANTFVEDLNELQDKNPTYKNLIEAIEAVREYEEYVTQHNDKVDPQVVSRLYWAADDMLEAWDQEIQKAAAQAEEERKTTRLRLLSEKKEALLSGLDALMTPITTETATIKS